jgi:hypothetical protein
MARTTNISYDAREIGDLVKSLARAGASVEQIQQRMLDIAEKGVAEPIRRRTPRRSGRLVRSIRTELVSKGASKGTGARVNVGEARVVQDTDIAIYGPIVHFGWSTRGLQKRAAAVRAENAEGKVTTAANRAAFRAQLIEAGFSKRAADKAFRTRKARKIKGSDRRVDRVRGGPIKPNPWLYDAVSDRRAATYERFERETAAIAKAFESEAS